jgi:3-carboxy-cis,cis-muconate cycloisomerase
MIAVFSDDATIRHALAFEAALARARAAEGLVAGHVADEIAACCETIEINAMELAEQAALAGTLAIPLVKRLRAALPRAPAAALHMGATSQDVADTVLMLQVEAAGRLLSSDVKQIGEALRALVERYAATPAVGRTLLQDALPIGFGLRFAQARAGIADAARRLEAEIAAGARIQLGGAAGTRDDLGGKGAAIAARMALDLGLATGAPWHARRTCIAGIGSALGILVGALGKLARDVSLLAQNALGEAREPATEGRGGSSAMAHKRNPTGCQVALSASIRAPGLVAALLTGLPQEQERGLGGWQAEAPVLADLFLLAAGSVSVMATVARGLEIDEAAIARNLNAAGIGADIGESEVIVAAMLAEQRD